MDRQKKGIIVSKRNKRSKAAPMIGLWLFLLIACIGFSLLLLNSKVFDVRYIGIEGNTSIPAEDIAEIGVLMPGENIFRMNTSMIAENIVRHPQIKSVTVERKLPEQIVFVVEERKPYAYLISSEDFIVIDDEAVYLYKKSAIDNVSMPFISGVQLTGEITPGVKITNPGLIAAIELINMLGSDIMTEISGIIAENPETLTLKTLQGVEIRFGKAEDLNRKIQMMQQLLIDNAAIFNDQTIEYIDLRYDTSLVIKRK